jgi:NIMA (never in mitosis gene a)-related kinase
MLSPSRKLVTLLALLSSLGARQQQALAFRPAPTLSTAGAHSSRPTTSISTRLAAVEFIDPSYNLAIGSFGVGLVGGALEDLRNADGVKLPTAKLFGAAALLFTLFAGLLTFQTTTLRFTFEETSFSLVQNDGSSIGDNIKVGGENSWKYSSFVNYDFLPSPSFPILVYFRETQTPVEN